MIVDGWPAVIDVGLAAIWIVGAGFAVTVTVVVAVALLPLPFAVAVYVVVAAGLTACVPPVAPRVNLLPSEPEIDTLVAFVATTVKIEELPAVSDAGFALIVTVGVEEPEPVPAEETVTVDAAVAEPPGPLALAV